MKEKEAIILVGRILREHNGIMAFEDLTQLFLKRNGRKTTRWTAMLSRICANGGHIIANPSRKPYLIAELKNK